MKSLKNKISLSMQIDFAIQFLLFLKYYYITECTTLISIVFNFEQLTVIFEQILLYWTNFINYSKK